MTDDLRRRTVLGGIGATVGSLAGCQSRSNDGSPVENDTESTLQDRGSPVPSHDHSTPDQGGGTLSPDAITAGSIEAETLSAESVTGSAFDAPTAEATFLVDKDDGMTVAIDPDTGAREYESEHAGDVLQSVFDRLRDGSGGRVFVRRNTYTVRRRLEIGSGYTQLASDFAELDFYDHERSEDGNEVESDLVVDPRDEPARHVEISGLILDGNKSERRVEGTRTVDVWSGSHVRFENCVIYGGKGDEGGAGYGIGEGTGTDFVSIDRCVIRDSDRHAYHPSASHHSITNSVFLENATEGGDVFDLAYTKAVVSNNHFENNGRGIRIDSNADAGREESVISVVNNTFIDNYSAGSAAGQLILSSPNSSSILVADNTFTLPTAVDDPPTRHVSGEVGAVTDSLVIRNNQFVGGVDEFSKVEGAGGKLGTVVVEDNTFQAVPTVRLGGIGNLVFRGNTFADVQLPRVEAFQIITGGVERGIVSDNVLFGHDGVPMAESLDEDGIVVQRNEYL